MCAKTDSSIYWKITNSKANQCTFDRKKSAATTLRSYNVHPYTSFNYSYRINQLHVMKISTFLLPISQISHELKGKKTRLHVFLINWYGKNSCGAHLSVCIQIERPLNWKVRSISIRLMTRICMSMLLLVQEPVKEAILYHNCLRLLNFSPSYWLLINRRNSLKSPIFKRCAVNYLVHLVERKIICNIFHTDFYVQQHMHADQIDNIEMTAIRWSRCKTFAKRIFNVVAKKWRYVQTNKKSQ